MGQGLAWPGMHAYKQERMWSATSLVTHLDVITHYAIELFGIK